MLAEAQEARYALGHALIALGDVSWRQGDAEWAVALWRRALVVRAQIADRRGIADSLERLAWGMATSGQAESAAWLLGAAEAQHRYLTIELRHDEQVDHADVLSAIQDRLPEAFDSAWSTGQAATVNEAVVAALEFTRAIPELDLGRFRLAAVDRTLSAA